MRNHTIFVNGEMTLGENLADAGGLIKTLKGRQFGEKRISAYHRYVATTSPEKRLPGLEEFSHEQIFSLRIPRFFKRIAKEFPDPLLDC